MQHLRYLVMTEPVKGVERVRKNPWKSRPGRRPAHIPTATLGASDLRGDVFSGVSRLALGAVICAVAREKVVTGIAAARAGIARATRAPCSSAQRSVAPRTTASTSAFDRRSDAVHRASASTSMGARRGASLSIP
jgi:hypothetical protein